MPFNTDTFERAQLEHRTESVNVPALADFFDSEPYEWIVRGLSGNELNKALEASQKNKELGRLAEALTEGGSKVEDIRKAIGLSSKTTQAEVAKRIEMLVAGSVDPVITTQVAVKLAENFPVDFMYLTNVISTLTGQGANLVKPEAALRETQNSGQQ